MGLWITKGIVDLHGGNVSVYSEGLGLGSTFTVELGMERKNNPSLISDQNPFIGIPPLSNRSSQTIVVAKLKISGKYSPSTNAESYTSSVKVKSEKGISSLQFPKSLEEDEKDDLQPWKPYQLLIVDDSALNRKMLLKIFRTAGHVCDEAVDGLHAIGKVKEKMITDEKFYSVILMDFVMPIMDGPTATKAIR